MLLKQVQYFVSIVKNNSFTIAAEENYISQSAISRAIKSLEDDIGTKLIKRSNRSFTLTNAGKYFYSQAIALLAEEERIKRETNLVAKQSDRVLKIGYINNYSGYEIEEAITDFIKENPKVRISIIKGNHEHLYNLMKDGKIDVVINDQRRALSNEYVNTYLYTAKCSIEVSKNSDLYNFKEVELKDLRSNELIFISSKEYEEHEKDYYKNTYEFIDNIIFAESIEEARFMVACNKGYMIAEETKKPKLPGTNIKRIPLMKNGERLERNLYVFYPKVTANEIKEKFSNILQKKFE